MLYIQVYIPDKNSIYDFRVSSQMSISILKNLILESIYNVKYDKDFVDSNFLFLNFYSKEVLDNNLNICDYGIYNGEKFILIW